MALLYTNKPTPVVGNSHISDTDLGFKNEVSQAFESYSERGINLADGMQSIMTNSHSREQFEDMLMESFAADPTMTDSKIAGDVFYGNYHERFKTLLDNSMTSMAIESVMTGYAPIVAYNPFFLKKQWVSCVFKDVVMTEVPTSPIINDAYEKRYIRTSDGQRYEIPDVFYKPEIMKTLMNAATGLSFKSDVDITVPAKNVDILTTTYVPNIAVTDGTRSDMLTQDIAISEVYFTTAAKWIPCDIRPEMTNHVWQNGKVKCVTTDTTYEDEIIGSVDFMTGKITVISKNEFISKIRIKGKLANRFNNRGLDIERRVEQVTHVMPESGPRLNTPITIEEAADALALQKIDIIADNVDQMGKCLAELEDFDIRSNLEESFNRQKVSGTAPHGYESLIAEGKFDAKPYTGYNGKISDWVSDSRLYVERIVNNLKQKLKTQDVAIVAVCHPEIVQYVQKGIDWVFTDDTQISGMKINYNFGILTTSQDKIHVITSQYVSPDIGIMFIVIPLKKELQTYKYYKFNMTIDRGYRNPQHSLVPNIMATHRTLFYEVLPVQGRLTVEGREFNSPENLNREVVSPPTGD